MPTVLYLKKAPRNNRHCHEIMLPMGDKKKKTTHSIGSALRDRGKKVNSDIADVWISHKYSEKKGAKKQPKHYFNFTTLKKKIVRWYGVVVQHMQNISMSLPKRLAVYKKSLITVLVVVALLSINALGSDKNIQDSSPQQLGSSSENGRGQGAELTGPSNIPQVSSTEFDLLFPNDSTIDDYEIVKVSPPENEPVYAFIDVFGGAELRVSQQELPEEFKINVDEKVKEVAENFQANSTIEIDDNKIYHGFSESNGGVQSLVFEKNGILVLVASPKQFSDVEWAGYISTLE